VPRLSCPIREKGGENKSRRKKSQGALFWEERKKKEAY